jgi:hypothetical protein
MVDSAASSKSMFIPVDAQGDKLNEEERRYRSKLIPV